MLSADLAAYLSWGHQQARMSLQGIDGLIAAQGLEAPAEAWPADLLASEGIAHEAPTELVLADLGINTVIWVMGYRPDLGWVDLPLLDEEVEKRAPDPAIARLLMPMAEPVSMRHP